MIHLNGINYVCDEKHIKSQVILNMCILWSFKPYAHVLRSTFALRMA